MWWKNKITHTNFEGLYELKNKKYNYITNNWITFYTSLKKEKIKVFRHTNSEILRHGKLLVTISAVFYYL